MYREEDLDQARPASRLVEPGINDERRDGRYMESGPDSHSCQRLGGTMTDIHVFVDVLGLLVLDHPSLLTWGTCARVGDVYGRPLGSLRLTSTLSPRSTLRETTPATRLRLPGSKIVNVTKCFHETKDL